MVIIKCPNCGAANRVEESKSQQAVCGRCGTNLSRPENTKPIEVTDETFAKKVLGSKRPILVDCWAPWCGPCRALTPVLNELAKESNGKYVIAKLNTDENPGIAGRFKIDAIPAMLIFKDGKLVDRLVGLQPKKTIAGRLAAL